MFVYIIVNDVNLKIYIGKTKAYNDLRGLRHYLQQKCHEAEHRLSLRSHLYAAIRKYGRGHFHIFSLFEGQTNEEICEHEKLLIKALGAQNHEVGYNICRGGEGFTGTFSAEARAKMSAAHKRVWADPELRKNHDEAMKKRRGIPRPPQVGEAVRRMRTGFKASTETKEKIRAARLAQPDPRLGTHHSEEARKRISEGHKGQVPWMKGKHHTSGAKEKNRRAHLIDLQGQQFGDVLVVSLAGVSSRGHAEWAVCCTVCDACGVVVRSGRVKNGDSAFMRAHRHTA